ncbi:MAG: Tm-1-like ATP-binding domain-containing protein [Planctomycetaceae bacterium]|nr:Tm-1-like ATP-binding domain-containing protein [Planctomycetaceae bacterium]
MQPAVYAIATMDTKGIELEFIAQRLRDAGVTVRSVDVGTLGPPVVVPDVTRDVVLGSSAAPGTEDRGAAVTAMGAALTQYLVCECERGVVAGVLGIGGSGGTAIITAAMRQLPVGLPKLMVSTMASGNTAPYIDCSDITMMSSVVDVAGLNAVSRRIFSNAAHAMAGMVRHPIPASRVRPTLGMTMFGVTTPCVTAVRQELERAGYDCLVFHATGTGGRAMEQLVRSGLIQGVVDITTTEVADEVVGGVLAAGPARFDALLEQRIPLVLSLGAVDMVNFGGRETIPEPFRNRLLHVHNPQVTLMRTTPQENRQIAHWITTKLNRSTAPLTLVIPQGGVSALDAPGQPFHDPAANQALFDELRNTFQETALRRLVWSPHHINDPKFAATLLSEFEAITGRTSLQDDTYSETSPPVA